MMLETLAHGEHTARGGDQSVEPRSGGICDVQLNARQLFPISASEARAQIPDALDRCGQMILFTRTGADRVLECRGKAPRGLFPNFQKRVKGSAPTGKGVLFAGWADRTGCRDQRLDGEEIFWPGRSRWQNAYA